MDTIQEKIRLSLLKNNQKIEELSVNLSIPSSLLIYDFIKSEFYNGKFDCFLELNELENYKYLSVNFYSLSEDDGFSQKINIFMEEGYNDELLLNTENTHIDGEYLTEEEYIRAIEILEKSPKIPSVLFTEKENYIFTEKEYESLMLIINEIDNLKEDTNRAVLYNLIKDKGLENNYIFLRQLTKIPSLNNLSYKNSFFKDSNLKEIKDDIKKINISNDQEKINTLKIKSKEVYNDLVNEIQDISCYLDRDKTKKILLNKKNNNLTYIVADQLSFEKILENQEISFNKSFHYLNQNDLGLVKLDLRDNVSNVVFIYAINEKKEIAGALTIVPEDQYSDTGTFIDLNMYKIKSLSTSTKFRGQNVSSKLYQKLLEYAEEKNIGIVRGNPTEDNKKYIYNKLEKISKSSNLLIVKNENDIYIYLKSYLRNNNIEIKSISDFKDIYDSFTSLIKNNNIKPKMLTMRKNDEVKIFLNKILLDKNKPIITKKIKR
jgi:hypothetical protein